jgi:uncharacterized protein YqgC (DUF456 family)
MVWVLYFLLLLVSLLSLVLVILTMPGLWLMTAGAAGYALATHHLGVKALLVVTLLAIAGEIVEVAVMGREARRAGGRRGTGLGAFVGGIVGALLGSFIPIPILGTILGLCLGCFFGAAAVEWMGGSRADKSIQVGIGAAKGRAVGVGCKFAIGCVMILLIIVMAWP